MQIMDQFGAAPGAESVRMPDGTERTPVSYTHLTLPTIA